jgi:hypothetical protein
VDAREETGSWKLRTSGWAARFTATDAGEEDVAIAIGTLCLRKKAIASLAPGISATNGIRADKFSSH